MSSDVRKEIYSKPKISLDTAMGPKISQGVHIIKAPVRSIVITRTTSSTAVVYANFIETGERVLLKPGVPKNFDKARKSCVLEWDAQTGIEIDVEFSADTHLQHHEFTVSSVGKTFASGGTKFDEGLKTVTTVESLAFPANDDRVMLKIEHRGSTVWRFGKAGSTLQYLYPGEKLYWDLTAGLYLKSESGIDTNGLCWFEQYK